ncbi:MAG: metallophosphoesterase family protein, partial [Anaerolineales bacterium]|nr:metallophosphoesterase family protein [Anaerolineales bacterium]
MKILALSDEVVDSIYSPRITERFADVDLVVGCGDLPFYYLEFVVTMLNRPVYYVHGNHDKPSQYLSDGRIIDQAEGCLPLETLSVRAQSRGRDLLLAGLGGSLQYNFGQHQYSQRDMHRRVLQLTPALLVNRARYGRFLDVLITHAPPRGIHDSSDRAHTGFEAFL